jgi:transcription-repair coupling factor (superfamily II helicase)
MGSVAVVLGPRAGVGALDRLLPSRGRARVGGVPEGHDALLLAGASGTVLHVARDDLRLATLAETIAFFAPKLEVLRLPAWDCLPYDRVSPQAEIAAQRMETLSRLVQPASGPRVVLTTINAATQRLPRPVVVAGSSFRAALGASLDLDGFRLWLARNGYVQSGTVMEPGEFAVRGGIVDLFPPGPDGGLRLDLFGDTLEAVRRFDPLTQRTTGERLPALSLVPVSEVALDPAAIERFRAGYRALFGAVTDDDPLYAAVSAGRKHMGFEHWLPLFHDGLATLFDYLPDAAVTLDHQVDAAREARGSTVIDYYQARRDAKPTTFGDAPVYKPLPPEQLYLLSAEWDAALEPRRVAAFSPFVEGESAIDAGGKPGRDFAPERAAESNVYAALRDHVNAEQAAGQRVLLASYSGGSRDRLSLVLQDHGIQPLLPVESWDQAAALPKATTATIVLGIERGFRTEGLTLIGEQDILGDRLVRPRRRSRRAENFLTEHGSLAAGDLVVHIDHGIGRYEGLRTIEVSGSPHDCLLLTYDGGDRLFVPVENIEVLSRYGAESAGVPLDKLGGVGWQARKARLKNRIRDMAEQLMAVAAQRELRRSATLVPAPGIFEEFCNRFPFDETDDQARAIDDVLEDLGAGRPMDRLICGDVGFGKTEVALRSAFVAVMGGKQVAIVTPTTLLARQHFQTFSTRFSGLPVRIGQLSRLVPAKKAAETRAEMKDGKCDIVVGTHALLAKSVGFKDLGLLIIDEEQHFGVAHKERLKQLRADVHVLTLTATPIPRTLQLALSGVREMSLIATPPVDRLAVRTFVLPFDQVVVREALLREHYRGGQSFYVCPRIEDLPDAADFLRQQVPELKFATAHGRLPPTELEDVMSAFCDGQYHVLLSTNIIESGLDIASANTMVVHRADMFGLAQLYQLRGRIGRSKLRGYAYFTLPPRKPPTAQAQQRLEVLQTLDSLGAGFSLASHDLDIRGAGNLLGEEQSGHIKEVGLELYQELLEQAVAAAKGAGVGAAVDDEWSPQINIGTAVLIPEDYVADLDLRLGLYRRLSRLEEPGEIDAFAAELIDRFGKLPEAVDHLLRIVAIKQLCRQAGIEKIEAGPKGATLSFRGNTYANPVGLVDFISRQVGSAKLRTDHRLVYMRDWPTPDARLTGVHTLMRRLAEIAKAGAQSPAGAGSAPAASRTARSKT